MTKISEKNTKMGWIPSVSLPPIITCRPNAPCKKDCYALKAYRCYKRTKKGGEARLHEKWSIGVGGHINKEDFKGTSHMYEVLSNGTTRELTEELDWGADSDPKPQPGGLIYDPSNPVGEVHFGVVIMIDVADNQMNYPRLKEDSLTELKWLSVEEAKELPNLENWSKMALETL